MSAYNRMADINIAKTASIGIVIFIFAKNPTSILIL